MIRFAVWFGLCGCSLAATLPSGFTESLVAGGISDATAMEFAPDGRLFVSQQTGELRVIKNGALLATPFITLPVDPTRERGLLGIAFDPDFTTNQFVYLYYTFNGSPQRNRVSRFTANGDVAVANSEVVIFELDDLSSNMHNGGAIHFHTDGTLFIAVGDNANGANAQSFSTVLGKILRINRDGSIPSNNPFVATTAGKNQAIWALGLRNPFTFAFQPGTSRLFINDVGESTWEEINDGIAGSNYGWPDTEGATSNPAFRSPLFVYGHGSSSTTGCAITGGAFYNPPTVVFPASYVGTYFFADLCSGWIRRFNPATGTATDFASGISNPVDLKVWQDGNLYYLARASNAVFKVTFSSAAPTAPTGLTATAVSTSQINLAWTDTSSNEDGFSIEISTDGTAFALLDTAAPNATTFPATGLNAGTAYFFRVIATSTAFGNSAPSNVAGASTNGGGGGGSISGSFGASSPTVNLTAEGTSDWAHWGLASPSDFNHKAGVTQAIAMTPVNGSPARYGNNPTDFTWTDGTPMGSASNTTSGIYQTSEGRGFQITVPADTSLRTLKVYVALYASQGQMTAQLSDGSATAFLDNSFGTADLDSGVYTLAYKAASNGQTLTVTWTQIGGGNVALNAATLTVPAAAPDFSITAAPSSRTVTAGSGTTYTATISAIAGFSGTVGFSVTGLPGGATSGFSPSTVTGSGASTLTLTTSASTPATAYPLTITATSGSLSHSANVTLNVTASSGGGSLSGSFATPSATVNLTTEGTSDWGQWGFTSSSDFNHKDGVTQAIAMIPVGGVSPSRYGNNPTGFTWTDGTPAGSASNITTGIYFAGQGSGFQITVPADTALRTLKVYVALYASQGQMTAHLSDGSSADFLDASFGAAGLSSGVYTLVYQAASNGQTLTVTWTQTGTGNVALNAVTLAGQTAPQDFSITATPPSQTVTAGTGTTFTATISPIGGFSGTVGFSVTGLPGGATSGFSPSSVTGSGASTLTLTTSASTPAASYPLTITATSGSLSHSADVTLNVTSGGGTGSLSGSFGASSATVNLTTEGTADWGQWGFTSPSDFNHKAGVTQAIAMTPVGGVSPSRYGNNPTGFTWTDGTPAGSASNITTGIYFAGQGSGFQITVPADTTLRTLRVYVALYASQGQMTAHLSDGSSADFLDTSFGTPGLDSGVYTLAYKAASSGQTLTVTWTQTGTGNVALNAASLQ